MKPNEIDPEKLLNRTTVYNYSSKANDALANLLNVITFMAILSAPGVILRVWVWGWPW